MTDKERAEFEHCALLSARTFVLDQLPATLLTLSLRVDADRKHILFRAHFDAPPSEDDIEAIGITSTEVVAQYYDWMIDEDWEILKPGEPPNCLPTGIAWHRPGSDVPARADSR